MREFLAKEGVGVPGEMPVAESEQGCRAGSRALSRSNRAADIGSR
jgi:hypothetical protein